MHTQNFSQLTKYMNNPTECENFESLCYRALEKLMGSVSDGSDTKVSLSHDDATGECLVTVGNRVFYDKSLSKAIYKAYQQTVEV